MSILEFFFPRRTQSPAGSIQPPVDSALLPADQSGGTLAAHLKERRDRRNRHAQEMQVAQDAYRRAIYEPRMKLEEYSTKIAELRARHAKEDSSASAEFERARKTETQLRQKRRTEEAERVSIEATIKA